MDKQNIDINKMSADDIRKHADLTAYSGYLTLGNVNTKNFLMFAELIDNSIGSIEVYNKFHNLKWEEKLIIEIEINLEGKELNIDELEIIEGSYINFTDNAKGIRKDDLYKAAKLDNKVKKISTSTMNVHGRGLKQCVYFFGIDWSISTTTLEDGSYYVPLKVSEQVKLQAAIYWVDIFKKENQTIGTTIRIENIYKNKVFSENAWSGIVNTLQFRYINYLKSERIEIKYKFNKSKNWDFFKVAEEPTTSFGQLFEVIDTNEIGLNKFITEAKTALISLTKKPKTKHPLDSEICWSCFEEITLLLSESYNNNQLEFKWDLKLPFLNNKNLNFKFWVLPKNKKSYRGIRLFDGERAVLHAGSQEKETRPYMGWYSSGESTVSSGASEYRFAGECDLSEVGIKPKTDKSSFSFSENEKMRLNKIIFSVFEVFCIFLAKSKKEAKFSKGNKLSSDNLKRGVVGYNQKFPNKNLKYIEYDEIKKIIKFDHIDKNGKIWTIIISEDRKARPSTIWNFIELSPDAEDIEIIANTAHVFWRDIDKLGDIFFTEAVIPITLLFIMQAIDLDEYRIKEAFDSYNTSGNFFDN